MFMLISVSLKLSFSGAGIICPLHLSNHAIQHGVCCIASLTHTHWIQDDRRKCGRERAQQNARKGTRNRENKAHSKKGGREVGTEEGGMEEGSLAFMIQERRRNKMYQYLKP